MSGRDNQFQIILLGDGKTSTPLRFSLSLVLEALIELNLLSHLCAAEKVGKTSLIDTYITLRFPEKVFDISYLL